ncbi:MAG: hypothetical protein RL302_1441 [Pseudomonadota bacterium]|jgi:hypothetical protein
MLKQRLMWIGWPSFLMAGVLEMLVFSLVDPEDLHWFGHQLEFSRQGIYTVSFFVFWLVASLSSALTTLLSLSSSEINRKPLD